MTLLATLLPQLIVLRWSGNILCNHVHRSFLIFLSIFCFSHSNKHCNGAAFHDISMNSWYTDDLLTQNHKLSFKSFIKLIELRQVFSPDDIEMNSKNGTQCIRMTTRHMENNYDWITLDLTELYVCWVSATCCNWYFTIILAIHSLVHAITMSWLDLLSAFAPVWVPQF